MPSYYDSTKTKPGLAEIKYKKGGKVKKMAHGGALGQISERERDLQRRRGAALGQISDREREIRRSDPEKRESVRKREAAARAKRAGIPAGLLKGGRGVSRVSKARGDSLFERLQAARNASAAGSPLGQISERELALLERRERKGALGQVSEMERELLRRAKGMATGGQVKKMKGGGTVARGSGAARKQAFGKNG